MSDNIVNPIKKVSEFTYRLALWKILLGPVQKCTWIEMVIILLRWPFRVHHWIARYLIIKYWPYNIMNWYVYAFCAFHVSYSALCEICKKNIKYTFHLWTNLQYIYICLKRPSLNCLIHFYKREDLKMEIYVDLWNIQGVF